MLEQYPDLSIDERTIVCSAHFHPDSYRTDGKKRILKRDAIPTIFRRQFANCVERKKKKRQSAKEGETVKKNGVSSNVKVDLSKDNACMER